MSRNCRPCSSFSPIADRPLAGDQAQQREAERGLARAALADHADRLALAHGDVDAVDRLDMVDRAAQHAGLDREPDLDLAGRHHGAGVGRGRRRVALGLGGQQALGVGVLRRGEHRLGRARLDDLALVHDADPVGHLADDAEIVGDQQQRHAEAALQALQQLQDLGLDGDVERRGRLVGDQEVGLVGQRHGDHHPLALAAGQLVRIGVQPLLRVRQADQAQQLQHPGAGLGLAHALVQRQHLADLLLDRVQRVQRGHRLLEHHRDLVAADLAQHLLRRAEQLLAAIADAALGVARAGIGQQLQDRQRGDRLARAALADQRQGLAAVELKRHALAPPAPRRRAPGTRPPGRGPRAARSAGGRVVSVIGGWALGFGHGIGGRRGAARRPPGRLARVEGVAHRLADEDQQAEHDGQREEGGEAEPRRLQVGLALADQLAERGRAGRQAEAEEVERRSAALIEPVRMNGRKVRVATIAFGSMCRHMITRSGRPSARAART